MKYIVDNGILIKCAPDVPEQVIERDGVRVRIQTQELDLVIPEGVESVGPKAFDAVKTYVETIRFPASFKSPEGCRFKDLANLKRVVFAGDIETVPHGAFSGLKALESVIFRRSVRTIEESAFSKCRSLEEIVFSRGLETIGPYAFFECRKLKDFRLPGTLRYVGACAFCGCRSLTEVVFPESEGLYLGCGAFSDISRLKRIVIPEGAECLNQFAFSTGARHVELVLPASLKRFSSERDARYGIMGSRFYGGLLSKWHDYKNNVAYPSIEIVAPKGAYAVRIAKTNNLPYREI